MGAKESKPVQEKGAVREVPDDDLADIGLTPEQLQRLKEKKQRRDIEKCKAFTMKILDPISSCEGKELRLVLLGKTGAGKSSTGNLILGGDRFIQSASSTSVTKTIKLGEVDVDDIRVRLIDTPGFFDTGSQNEKALDNNEIISEIAKVFDTFHEGIHGFLFVFNAAEHRFTEQHREILDLMFSKFGSQFLECCYMVFSHWDVVKVDGEMRSLTEYLKREKSSVLGQVVTEHLKNRVIAVDNSVENGFFKKLQREQVVRLVASSETPGYVQEDMEKHRQMVQSEIDESMRKYVPMMEKEFAKLVEGKSYKEIKQMKPAEKNEILQTVVAKVKAMGDTRDVEDDQLRRAAEIVLEGKKDRLTGAKILNALRSFVIPLLSLAMEVVPVVCKIIKLISLGSLY